MKTKNYPTKIHATHSYYIGQKGAETIYRAFGLAEKKGFTLNYCVAINFASTLCDPTQAVTAFSQLRALFLIWAQTSCVEPMYVYAFQNVRDDVPFMSVGSGQDHNVEVQWAVHIPVWLLSDFESDLSDWVDYVTGGITDPQTIVTIEQRDMRGTRAHLLKGADPTWCSAHGIVSEPKGVIAGRRTGTSPNIGLQAQRASEQAAGIMNAAYLSHFLRLSARRESVLLSA